MNVVVVIPAYNEAKTISGVVSKALVLQVATHNIQVIVVDDGSSDDTADIARKAGALVLSHPINRGLGAALSTGIEAAQQVIASEAKQSLRSPRPFGARDDNNGGVIVTLDADGQHDPTDLPRVIEPILKGEAEVVIGSRFITPPHSSPYIKGRKGGVTIVPWQRRLANFCGNFFTWLLFGIWVSDSQSGLRAFSTSAARKLELRTSTMEVSSEIIREIARLRLFMAEVPISVSYTSYSLSKGQGLLRGLETLWKLVVLKFFR